MKTLAISPVAAAILGCLAFLVPVKPAMAGVTSGTVVCPPGSIMHIGDAVGCIIEIPGKVSPPGHGGSSNPNDWGMCGVLSITADYGPPTVARIIIDSSGYYAVELAAYMPSVLPKLDWTCVLFSDFKGTPPVADAIFLGAASYDGTTTAGGKAIAGSAGNACIWSGLRGNLETLNINEAGGTDGAFGYAYAEYDGSKTAIAAENTESYAFCSGYSGWNSWKFLNHSIGFSMPLSVITLKGLDTAHDWCYAQGIEAYLLYPNYSVGTISAGLGHSGIDYTVFATPAGGIGVSYNCLPLTQ